MITIEKMISNLFELLNLIVEKEENDIDHVLVEQQPPRNKKTKILSHSIQMYFLTRNIRFNFVNAKNKLKIEKSKMDYNQRKQWSILTTTEYLYSVFDDNKECYNDFIKLKKRDDVSDTLLQTFCAYEICMYDPSSDSSSAESNVDHK